MNDYTPMDGVEFQLALRKLGLDRETAAVVLEVSVRSIERYEKDEARIPKASAILLRALVKGRRKGFDTLSDLVR